MKYLKQIPLLMLSGVLLMTMACKPKLTPTADPNWEPTDKALLWKLDRKGHKTSYLFGTIHMIPEEDFFWPEQVDAALAATEQIVYEIDISEMTDMSNILGMMNSVMMPDNQRLSDLLSADDYKTVAAHFEEMGLPAMMIDRIKPFFLSVMAGQDLTGGFDMMGGEGIKSYELEFNKKAERLKLKSGGLESIDDQMALFDEIPLEDQAQMLLEAVKDGGEVATDQLDEIVKIYKSQDLKAMHDMTMQEDMGISDFSDKLLYDRNANWIPQIETITEEVPSFFAVGAGHLGGQNGVLALLKKRGWMLTPIP